MRYQIDIKLRHRHRGATVSEDKALCRKVAEALENDALRPKAKAPAALARAASGGMDERTIVGGVNEVSESLAGYRDVLDMDLLVVRASPPGASEAECERSVELLATRVGPQVSTA